MSQINFNGFSVNFFLSVGAILLMLAFYHILPKFASLKVETKCTTIDAPKNYFFLRQNDPWSSVPFSNTKLEIFSIKPFILFGIYSSK